MIKTRSFNNFTIVPGILFKELRNPAIAFLVTITVAGFFPITQQVNSVASLIIPILVVLLGLINSIIAECRKKAYDEATNKAQYSKYVLGDLQPIESKDIQCGDIIEIKDG